MPKKILVVGGGLAGLAAVFLARARGYAVELVASDFGATQHFSGAFDVADPRWKQPNMEVATYPAPKLCLRQFIKGHPEHLYALCDQGIEEFVHKWLAAAAGFFDFYGLEVDYDETSSLCVVGSMGKIKPTAYALSPHALRTREARREVSVAVVEIPALKEYPGYLIAKQLGRHFDRVQRFTYEGQSFNRTGTTATFLHSFDLQAFATYLKPLVTEVQIVFVPPVFGVSNFHGLHQEFQAELGVRVVEMLSVLPSISGLRLTTRVTQALQNRGIPFRQGNVKRLERRDGQVEGAVFEDSEGTETVLRADGYIVATGSFLGGGLRGDSHGFEAVLGGELSRAPITQLIDREVTHTQPVFNLGVPREEGKNLKNLRFCGHVAAGFDFTRERCGFGVSLGSAQLALEELSSFL